MRRIRARLTIIMICTVIGSSAVSLTVSAFIRNGGFRRQDMRYILYGFALKDVLLLLIGIAVAAAVIWVASRNTVNPVVQLNRATREIASGNFDIHVKIQDRIEEFGELAENFNRMAAELRSNEYLRKDFISNVSHQLRTPLSVVQGYARLLEEGGLTESEQRDYARTIAAETERLSALTGDMLRLSRMDHRALRLKERSFSLDEQLRQAILRLEPRWREKGIRLEPELASVTVSGDEELLAEVWENLLDNAVKFTPPGGCIAVGLRGSRDWATVTVTDSGRGMAPEELSRIFEQFYRGDASRSGEGNGLGLPLARRIIELHKGSIRAESRPGEGSAFTVTLPRTGERRKGG